MTDIKGKYRGEPPKFMYTEMLLETSPLVGEKKTVFEINICYSLPWFLFSYFPLPTPFQRIY